MADRNPERLAAERFDLLADRADELGPDIRPGIPTGYYELFAVVAEGTLDDLEQELDRRDADLSERSLAEFYTLADAWLIGPPDDPKMRAYLIKEDNCSPEQAERVLARMRELGRERGLASSHSFADTLRLREGQEDR
jgi:hypothetical protein